MKTLREQLIALLEIESVDDKYTQLRTLMRNNPVDLDFAEDMLDGVVSRGYVMETIHNMISGSDLAGIQDLLRNVTRADAKVFYEVSDEKLTDMTSQRMNLVIGDILSNLPDEKFEGDHRHLLIRKFEKALVLADKNLDKLGCHKNQIIAKIAELRDTNNPIKTSDEVWVDYFIKVNEENQGE